MYIRIKDNGLRLLRQIKNQSILEDSIKSSVVEVIKSIYYMKENLSEHIYAVYQEFFESFLEFCLKSVQYEFLLANMDMMKSSLELFVECMGEIIKQYEVKKCVCCGNEVIYMPLPKYYEEMQKKSGKAYESKGETLNKEEYLCPLCMCSDRDRLIISFLKKNGLQKAAEGASVLQFAPVKAITHWIKSNCPHIKYETTDLFMDNVTYRSDIQNMSMVQDNTYDIIICSHVLEHVQNDGKAMQEMKRILKTDGKIIFLVPIDLNANEIDEEWGLTEEENWRRFGQGDHCRRYSKEGLLERLAEHFFVNELGKEYFGEEVFKQCGLTDTSTLYVLTKTQSTTLELEEIIVIDEKLCKEGPLVSVVLPAYNHEQFVAEAIESVIDQSYKNIEILVADDGSTDNTAAIMKKYSKYFAKEFYFEENAGSRIKELTACAKGKYIAWMHSDDIWEKDKIAMQVEYLERHSECDICLSWCKYTDEELQEKEDTLFIQKNRNSYEWMKFFWENGNVICNPSLLMRTKIADDLPRYGMACRQTPDFFKWIYYVQKYSIHIIPKVLIKMRRYQKENVQNVSACTRKNSIRHLIEEGNNWMWVIRDMDADFFRKAFQKIMINPDAKTEEEMKCEKYFLLLKHHNIFVQNSAFIYISEIYSEIYDCIKEKYGYSRINLAEDMLNKGYAKYFL